MGEHVYEMLGPLTLSSPNALKKLGGLKRDPTVLAAKKLYSDPASFTRQSGRKIMNYTSRQKTPDTVHQSDGTDKEKVVTRTVADSRELTADLFVRSLSPIGARSQQTAVIKRLNQLVHDDRLMTYTVTVWGRGICLDEVVTEVDTTRTIIETIQEFKQWAEQENLVLGAGFEERTTSSIDTEKETTVIEFPTMCLAIREGSDSALRCIAPCSDTSGKMKHSITDCLNELEGEVEAPDHDWPPVSVPAD